MSFITFTSFILRFTIIRSLDQIKILQRDDRTDYLFFKSIVSDKEHVDFIRDVFIGEKGPYDLYSGI